MSDRLTFSWFVGTCNLSHPATGPQEALWIWLSQWFEYYLSHWIESQIIGLSLMSPV